ncbi:hypothetical protein V8D89_012963 [Ganoderma adspersum]
MGYHAEQYVHAGVAAISDNSLSVEQAADEIAKQCKQSMDSESVPKRADSHGALASVAANDESHPTDVEKFLWPLWTDVLNLARDDASTHDRIAHVIAALNAKGAEGCEGWSVWGSKTDWSQLPLLGPVSREEMNGPQPFVKGIGCLDLTTPKAHALLSGDAPTDDEPETRAVVDIRKHWLNTNAFLARLWALDVQDEAFFGIACMRMNLEPLTLSSTHEPTAGQGSVFEPQELQIEVAASWLRIAGAKMYACREIMGPKGNPDWEKNRGCPGGSGGTWDGVDGYHLDRWTHWKGILREVAEGSWRSNVIEAAQAALEAMEKVERETQS